MPQLTGCAAFECLPLLVRLERIDNDRRKVQDAVTLPSLWLDKLELPTVPLQGPPNAQRATVEVDVIPANAECFAEAQAQCDAHGVQCGPSISLDRCQKIAGLLRGER